MLFYFDLAMNALDIPGQSTHCLINQVNSSKRILWSAQQFP